MNTNETPMEAAKRLLSSDLFKGFSLTIYTYENMDKTPIYWRLRLDKEGSPKIIRPMCLTDKGYVLKEPAFGGKKPLYNLYLIHQNLSAPVWLVEGEKCAEQLTKLGVIATTSGGATSASMTDWSALEKRRVIIWPDNDISGASYACDVERELAKLNTFAEKIDISKLNLLEKEDVADWILRYEARHEEKPSVEDLMALDRVSVSSEKLVNEIVAQEELRQYLSKLSEFDYERQRRSLSKKLDLRTSTLDNLYKDSQGFSDDGSAVFDDIEPWDQPIIPSLLLDEIATTIRRFVVLDDFQSKAAALWVSASWFIDEIHCAPIALINAPEKACGKTQLLTVLSLLAKRSTQASGITPSVLFRMIEAYKPTLFIDEIETILKDNEELRGLINAGHTRNSAFVWRSASKEKDFAPTRFNVWGMKAIAGINAIKMAETVTSRSIVFELRRKTADEKVERLRYADPDLFSNLAAKLARFHDDYFEQVKNARPSLPDELGDRDQDNWEPLIQIAYVAGNHWPESARAISLRISEITQGVQSISNQLLSDIQEVVEKCDAKFIKTSDLISLLCKDEEMLWATYNRGSQLTPRQLSLKLKDYGIKPKNIKEPKGAAVFKGYFIEAFKEAFSRYLIKEVKSLDLSATPLPSNKNEHSKVADMGNDEMPNNSPATSNSNSDKGCSVVAEKIAEFSTDEPIVIFDEFAGLEF